MPVHRRPRQPDRPENLLQGYPLRRLCQPLCVHPFGAGSGPHVYALPGFLGPPAGGKEFYPVQPQLPHQPGPRRANRQPGLSVGYEGMGRYQAFHLQGSRTGLCQLRF